MKIGAGFGVAVLIFLLVGVVSYNSTTQLIEAAERRKQTFQLLGKLEELRSDMQDIQLGERGYGLTGEDSYLDRYRPALASIQGDLQNVRQLSAGDARAQQRLDLLESHINKFRAFAEQSVETIRASGLQAGLSRVQWDESHAEMNAARRVMSVIRTDEEAKLEQLIAESEAAARRAQWIIPIGTTIALVIAALAGVFITRNIARRLATLTTVAERITIGDLSVDVPPDADRDEVGVLGRSFEAMVHSLRGMSVTAEQIAAGDLRHNVTPGSPKDTLGTAFARMVENLRDQTRQLVEGANVLGASASQIMSSTSQLAASSSESAAAVSETSTTVEEVRQTAQLATQKAQFVFDSAQKAALISQEGRRSTDDVSAGMERIRQQMEAIAGSMGRLSEQSQTIGQIIATVDDLAAQSNLLAVNAAIEAAKAGEHGKGFAVVAQEVRSLAGQSRQATNDVRTVLHDIQKATTAAVLATEQGTKAVEAGIRQSEVAGSSIESLTDSVTDAAQAATQIAASSQQQLVGVDQVATAMDSIKQATTQNVAGAKQLESAARNLNELGLRLKRIVERYQI